MKGKLISLEGISGIGKTHLINKLRDEFIENDNVMFMHEVFSEKHEGIKDKIFSTLYHTNDIFFNMGIPFTETLLLLALEAFANESKIAELIEMGKIVVKDRAIDTPSVYQGVLLSKKTKEDPLICANRIYDIASQFTMPPDYTFLLLGDVNKSIKRAERRNRKPYTMEQVVFLHEVAMLYPTYAKRHIDRISAYNIDEGVEIIYHEIRRVINLGH